MESDMPSKPSGRVFNVVIRLVICTLVLGAGVAGMAALTARKKPPAEVDTHEQPLPVEAVLAVPGEVPVVITGYGTVDVLNTVPISPEVSGRIVAVHPRLEAGEVIDKGELLFRVDDSDYRASLLEAAASVEQIENSILRLEKQYALDRERLKTLERNRDLSRAEYDRVLKLHGADKAMSRSSLDTAEQQYNNRSDLADQMSLTVVLYPIRIQETQSSLAAARARLAMAETRLSRCEVPAPFRGRVKSVSLEKGQYVLPGQTAVTLADDAELEIRVPLDSRDARNWLVFSRDPGGADDAWFDDLAPASCRIRWTEDMNGHYWTGRLDRVVAFNRENRTVTVAVRLDARQARSPGPDALPLVEGMFCSVEIPGPVLRGVYVLPRWAVGFDNTVHVARDNRLHTVRVQVARIQGEQAIVSEGLRPGDPVIVTRLIDPLENALLEVAVP